jgi:hypothetical protein
MRTALWQYTGTVKSCASTIVYPRPRMTLGALYVKPYSGIELPRYTITASQIFQSVNAETM